MKDKKNSVAFWHSSLQLSAMDNAQGGLGEEGSATSLIVGVRMLFFHK